MTNITHMNVLEWHTCSLSADRLQILHIFPRSERVHFVKFKAYYLHIMLCLGGTIRVYLYNQSTTVFIAV
jgi:hypothetical protein